MSSPRRATKDALDRAAKAARGSRPAQAPAKATAKPATNTTSANTIAANTTAAADAKSLIAAIERGIADGRLDVLPAPALQAVIAAAARLYAARREAGEDIMPVGKHALTATDVMVTASGLLRAADLAAFELGMWQGWTGR
jgi:hypothetical protein